jgi:hypothetical protein
MVVVLESALVLVFPAFALWAARTGGTGRLWRVTAVALALIGGLALMAASAGFGNRLAAQQGYGRTALGTLALARSSGGYRSSRAPSRCTPPGAGSAADGASTSSARLPPSWLSCWGGSPRCTSSARSPEPGGDVDGIRHSDILRSSPFCRARSTAARNAQWASTA